MKYRIFVAAGLLVALWGGTAWSDVVWHRPYTAGFVDAWGTGTATQAVQPGTSYACDPNHLCQLITQGAVTAQTFFGAGGEIGERQPFVVVETIDFSRPSSNAAGAFCYPVAGDFSVTDSEDTSSMLVLHFQGQACHLGSDTSGLLVIASYVATTDSTGRFQYVSGIGSMSLFSLIPSGTAPQNCHFFLAYSGNLRFATQQDLIGQASQ